METVVKEIVRELARKMGKGKTVTVHKSTIDLARDASTSAEFEAFQEFLRENNIKVVNDE